MGEGELIRKVVGTPRKQWHSEADCRAWIKAQYAELGIRGPLQDELGNKIDEITDDDQKPNA